MYHCVSTSYPVKKAVFDNLREDAPFGFSVSVSGPSRVLLRQSLTLMVTLMALFMLPLCSQPCFVMPPFWEPSDAVSCRRTNTVRVPSHYPPSANGTH